MLHLTPFFIHSSDYLLKKNHIGELRGNVSYYRCVAVLFIPNSTQTHMCCSGPQYIVIYYHALCCILQKKRVRQPIKMNGLP